MGAILTRLFGYARRTDLPPRTERVVVITGCDTGFGCEAAKALDRLGYHVVAGCLTEEGAAALRTTLSFRSHTVSYDVTQESHHEQVAASVRSQYPHGIYAVVCNAGIFAVGPTEWEPMRDVRKVFEVNYFGAVQTVKAFLPQLMARRGRVVFLSSAASRLSQPDWSTYSASKFAVAAYADSLRREMAGFGVQVISLEPGYTKTALLHGFKDRFRRMFEALPASVQARYGEAYMKDRADSYDMFLSNSADPDTVVRRIVQAVEDDWPAPRQSIGIDSHLVAWGTTFLPHNWLDGLLALVAGNRVRPAQGV